MNALKVFAISALAVAISEIDCMVVVAALLQRYGLTRVVCASVIAADVLIFAPLIWAGSHWNLHWRLNPSLLRSLSGGAMILLGIVALLDKGKY